MSDCSIIQKIQFPDIDIVLFVFSFAEEKLRLAKVATTQIPAYFFLPKSRSHHGDNRRHLCDALMES
jgi:hypothetical protein